MRTCVLVCVGIVAAGWEAQGSNLSVYLSSPSSQTTFLTGATTVTFDSLATGNRRTAYNSSIGTYQLSNSARFNIQNANDFGGANSTRYMTFGAQSNTSAPITLQLNGAYNYFGFWWSAGDSNNGISFYDGTQLLVRVSTAAIVSALSAATVTAIDGTAYNTTLYKGNPNFTPKTNTAEPYSFVNFITAGHNFNRIIFDNSNTTASGFESDNHTVYVGLVNLPRSSVYISSYTTPSPEPATLVLTAAALGALALCRRRG